MPYSCQTSPLVKWEFIRIVWFTPLRTNFRPSLHLRPHFYILMVRRPNPSMKRAVVFVRGGLLHMISRIWFRRTVYRTRCGKHCGLSVGKRNQKSMSPVSKTLGQEMPLIYWTTIKLSINLSFINNLIYSCNSLNVWLMINKLSFWTQNDRTEIFSEFWNSLLGQF